MSIVLNRRGIFLVIGLLLLLSSTFYLYNSPTEEVDSAGKVHSPTKSLPTNSLPAFQSKHHLPNDKFGFLPSNKSGHLYFYNKPEDTLEGKVKAAIVILVRNQELEALIPTLKQFESKFNSRYAYPYVFLNDVEFTEEFKRKTKALTTARTIYGLIPKEHWGYPNWVNQTYAKECREKMAKEQVIYGGSESYRHMCRFNSGFFYRHPLLDEFDYYWRVEPGVEYFCNLDYDPFAYMAQNNKMYGFTIALFEYNNTIPSLWKTTREFMDKHPEHIPSENALKFIWNEANGNYNLCHFWSNFEIGDLRFYRSQRYMDYFNFLDKTGKFFYERWGDAPVHSIAAAMFLHPSQIHFFEDIGYKHAPFTHCPLSLQDQVRQNCDCGSDDSFDWLVISFSNLCFRLPLFPMTSFTYMLLFWF
ncbi:alpha-1,2-mannosyltransferase [Paraphysoderma sedebokerense]|nr:alpha-1,2-mannosyltransferase [Paraphysoderma sedebokerense]